MSRREENLALAHQGVEAFQRGDLEFILRVFHPDVEIFSPPELPNPVDARGRDAYLRWVNSWLDAWEVYEIEAKAFDAIDDHHVVVQAHQRGVGKGSGIEVEMRVYYML